MATSPPEIPIPNGEEPVGKRQNLITTNKTSINIRCNHVKQRAIADALMSMQATWKYVYMLVVRIYVRIIRTGMGGRDWQGALIQ